MKNCYFCHKPAFSVRNAWTGEECVTFIFKPWKEFDFNYRGYKELLAELKEHDQIIDEAPIAHLRCLEFASKQIRL